MARLAGNGGTARGSHVLGTTVNGQVATGRSQRAGRQAVAVREATGRARGRDDRPTTGSARGSDGGRAWVVGEGCARGLRVGGEGRGSAARVARDSARRGSAAGLAARVARRVSARRGSAAGQVARTVGRARGSDSEKELCEEE